MGILLIESMTLILRDIFFLIFMTGKKASGTSFRKGVIFELVQREKSTATSQRTAG